jgi:hypothetical protein
MGANAIPVAGIVMSGLFLTVVAWRLLDLAMHAMSLGHGSEGRARARAGRPIPEADDEGARS